MEEAPITNLTEKKHRMIKVRQEIGKISWAELHNISQKSKISWEKQMY
jgi:hypothetical protein